MNTPPLHIRVPADLRDAVKARAAENGETITDVILRALRDYVTPSAEPELVQAVPVRPVQAAPVQAVPVQAPRPVRSPGHPFAGIGKRCNRCGLPATEH